MTKLLPLAVILSVLSTAANAGEIDLSLGKLTQSNTVARQIVAATNNTGYPIRTLKLQCAFYRNRNLQAFGRAFADNISDGQTVYVEVVANLLTDKEPPNRAECEVVDRVFK
jgi:hypothetical protein